MLIGDKTRGILWLHRSFFPFLSIYCIVKFVLQNRQRGIQDLVKRAGRGQQFKRGIRKLFYRNEIFFLLAVLFLVGVLLGACLIRANGDSWRGIYSPVGSRLFESAVNKRLQKLFYSLWLDQQFFCWRFFYVDFVR